MSMSMSNEELMQQFQTGNTEALGTLYERLHEPLYCFLFRYTKEEQISVDTVHDTFEVLQKKKHTFDAKRGTVKSFLFQIAYRLLINKLNRRKRWQSILPFLRLSTARAPFWNLSTTSSPNSSVTCVSPVVLI